MNHRTKDTEPSWVQARIALHQAFEATTEHGTRVEVEFATRLGSGLTRELLVANVTLSPDPERRSGTWAAFVPRAESGPEIAGQVAQEVKLLRWLATRPLPFRVPRVLDALPGSYGPILVREFVSGIMLDLRAERPGAPEPWKTVAGIAAALHRLPASEAGFLDGFPTRRAHALAALRDLEALEGPEAAEALAWARSHLPPETPGVLLHGDLQKVLLYPGEPARVIDWELACRGDPAWDLAVLTRGLERPFQLEDGRARLLEAYGADGGAELLPADLHFYELCHGATRHRQAVEREGRRSAGVSPADALASFVAIARRVIG